MTPHSETFSSGGQAMPWDLFLPAPTPAHSPGAAVLLLHGSFGLLPPYRDDLLSFATALCARGIAAAVPHYLEATGTTPGIGVFPLIRSMRPRWRQLCADALQALAQDPRFDAAHLGLLGFSLGANLALSLAMDPPASVKPRCVVDFFGPSAALEPHWAQMPPALILHGTRDELVPTSDSEQVVSQLAAAGRLKDRDWVFTRYANQGHGFKEPALTESRDQTMAFITQRI